MSKWNQPLVPVDYPSPPRWAIARLITCITGNDRQRRSQVIHNLGYSKPERAALRLDHLIRAGECSNELRAHLPGALGLPVESVEEAFAETARQREQWQAECERYAAQRDRINFVPRLVLLHDKQNRRVPIFVLTLFGQRRLTWVEIPDQVLEQDYLDQLTQLPELVARWQETEDGRHSTEWLGRPVGFLYQPEHSITVHLDQDFGLQEVQDGPLPESPFSLRARNLELTRVLGFRGPDK
jgi:hypothetical protein